MDRGRLWIGTVLRRRVGGIPAAAVRFINSSVALADWWPLAIVGLGLMWFGSGSILPAGMTL